MSTPKTTKAYLVDGDQTNGKLFCVQFTVLGDVAAGFDYMANVEDTGDYKYIPREWLHGQDPDNFFVIRVKGNTRSHKLFIYC